MNIGDRVVSKQTGLPGVGHVAGIVSYDFFISTSGGQYKEKHPWDDLYMNWRNEFIIYVGYNEHRHPYSFDEFVSQCPIENIPRNELRVLYKHSKQTNLISYPIEDLELEVDEITSISSD